jgi:hypothetical protein
MEMQMREDFRMTATDPARVHPPGATAPADRFPRRVARLLNWGPAQVTAPALRWTVNGLTWTGALLMLVSAIIHVRLWADGGYQGVAVIGPLFLAQGVAGILLAVALGIFRCLGLIMAGAGLLAATAVGLLLSVHVGLFGFRESMAAPYAGLSLVVEFTGAVVLAAAATTVLAGRRRRRPRPHCERVWPPADRPWA